MQKGQPMLTHGNCSVPTELWFLTTASQCAADYAKLQLVLLAVPNRVAVVCTNRPHHQHTAPTVPATLVQRQQGVTDGHKAERPLYLVHHPG
jgi:hypothetical protein